MKRSPGATLLSLPPKLVQVLPGILPTTYEIFVIVSTRWVLPGSQVPPAAMQAASQVAPAAESTHAEGDAPAWTCTGNQRAKRKANQWCIFTPFPISLVFFSGASFCFLRRNKAFVKRTCILLRRGQERRCFVSNSFACPQAYDERGVCRLQERLETEQELEWNSASLCYLLYLPFLILVPKPEREEGRKSVGEEDASHRRIEMFRERKSHRVMETCEEDSRNPLPGGRGRSLLVGEGRLGGGRRCQG